MTMKVEVGYRNSRLTIRFHGEDRKWEMSIRRQSLQGDPKFAAFANGRISVDDIRQFIPNAATIQFNEMHPLPTFREFAGFDGDYTVMVGFPIDDEESLTPEVVFRDYRSFFSEA